MEADALDLDVLPIEPEACGRFEGCLANAEGADIIVDDSVALIVKLYVCVIQLLCSRFQSNGLWTVAS